MLIPVSLAAQLILATLLNVFSAPIPRVQSGVESRVKRLSNLVEELLQRDRGLGKPLPFKRL